jgi:hypothetical protein
MKDSDHVQYGKYRIKWSEYKQKYKNWDFSSKENKLIGASHTLYKIIGKRFCEANKLKYVEKNSSSVHRAHHILVVDKSQSMEEVWSQVMGGCEKYIGTRKDFSDKFSLILFGDEADM